MQRVSELLGKTIVAADSGQRIGRSEDLLLSANAERVIALVVRRRLLGSERVVLYDDVQTLGRDAIITRTTPREMGAHEWHECQIEAHRSSSLKGKRMIGRDGREVGTVADVYVDEDTGEVQAYDVAEQAFAQLITRHRVLPRPDEVIVGPDALIVSTRGRGDAPADEPGLPEVTVPRGADATPRS